MSVEVWHQQQESIARLEYALENCRLYAARHRKEEWAQHILRFCTDARVAGSPMRDARPEEVEWNKAQAAIDLKVPMSGIPELDAMIRESRRLDMATAAMQGMLSCPIQPQSGADMYARDAYEIADALLAASGKEERK